MSLSKLFPLSMLKVWTPSPSGAPTTQATFISQSSVTALEWIPSSERHFLYGTRNGIVRLCDRIERRTMQGGGGTAFPAFSFEQSIFLDLNHDSITILPEERL